MTLISNFRQPGPSFGMQHPKLLAQSQPIPIEVPAPETTAPTEYQFTVDIGCEKELQNLLASGNYVLTGDGNLQTTKISENNVVNKIVQGTTGACHVHFHGEDTPQAEPAQE